MITALPAPTEGSDPAAQTPSTPMDGPTWHQDIAPLLGARCGSCHANGGIGPFSVESYAEARTWGPAIRQSVEAGTMPPFFADDADCEMPAPLQEDLRLSQEDKDLIADWVEADMPEGDAGTAAPVLFPVLEQLDPVDATVALQQPFEVGGTRDVYQCFRLPVDLKEKVWLTGVDVVPDNDLVVHHVLVWSDPNDDSADLAGADGSYGCSGFPGFYPTTLVGAWTPGANPSRVPEGAGIPLDPGASLVVNIHYHPTGTTTEIDQSSVQLQWTTERPDREALFWLADVPFGSELTTAPFLIPPDNPSHVESSILTIPDLVPELTVFSVGPHMHYLGIEQRVTVNPGDKDEQCLIHTPNYRFDWQRVYAYDAEIKELPVLRGGDRLEVRCTYDNSTSNPFLAAHMDARGVSSPDTVGWGEETGDEMCMAIVGFLLP